LPIGLGTSYEGLKDTMIFCDEIAILGLGTSYEGLKDGNGNGKELGCC
jgi:hypothetical protein